MKGAELSEVQGVEESASTASQQLLEKHLMQYADLLSQQPQRHTQRQIWEQQQAEAKQQQHQQEQDHLDRLRQQKRLEFIEMKKSQLVKQSSEDSLSEREHAVEQSDATSMGHDGPLMAPQPIGGERRQPYLTTRSSPLLPPHAFTLKQQPNQSAPWGFDKPMRLGGEAADVWGPMIGGGMYSEPMHSNQAHPVNSANGNLQSKASENGSSNNQQRLGMPVPFNPYAHPTSQYPPGYTPTGHQETSLTHTDPGNGYSYAAEGPEPYTMWSTDDGDPIIPGIPLPGALFPTFLPSFESNGKAHLMGGSNIQPVSMASRMPPFPWTVNPHFPPPGPPPSTVPVPPQHMVTSSGDSSFPSGWPDRELHNTMGLDGNPFPPWSFEGSSSVPIKSAIATPPEPTEYENIRKIWGSPSPSSQCVSVWDVNRKSWGSPSDSSFTPPQNSGFQNTGLEIVDEAKALGAKLIPLSVGQKSTEMIDWGEACLQQENMAKLQSCSMSLADMDPSIINAYTKETNNNIIKGNDEKFANRGTTLPQSNLEDGGQTESRMQQSTSSLSGSKGMFNINTSVNNINEKTMANQVDSNGDVSALAELGSMNRDIGPGNITILKKQDFAQQNDKGKENVEDDSKKRQDRCWDGMNCPKIDTCPFRHIPGDKGLHHDEMTVTGQRKKHSWCWYGENCPNMEECPYRHAPGDKGKRTDQVQPVGATKKHAVCRHGADCRKKDTCPYRHDTCRCWDGMNCPNMDKCPFQHFSGDPGGRRPDFPNKPEDIQMKVGRRKVHHVPKKGTIENGAEIFTIVESSDDDLKKDLNGTTNIDGAADPSSIIVVEGEKLANLSPDTEVAEADGTVVNSKRSKFGPKNWKQNGQKQPTKPIVNGIKATKNDLYQFDIDGPGMEKFQASTKPAPSEGAACRIKSAQSAAMRQPVLDDGDIAFNMFNKAVGAGRRGKSPGLPGPPGPTVETANKKANTSWTNRAAQGTENWDLPPPNGETWQLPAPASGGEKPWSPASPPTGTKVWNNMPPNNNDSWSDTSPKEEDNKNKQLREKNGEALRTEGKKSNDAKKSHGKSPYQKLKEGPHDTTKKAEGQKGKAEKNGEHTEGGSPKRDKRPERCWDGMNCSNLDKCPYRHVPGDRGLHHDEFTKSGVRKKHSWCWYGEMCPNITDCPYRHLPGDKGKRGEFGNNGIIKKHAMCRHGVDCRKKDTCPYRHQLEEKTEPREDDLSRCWDGMNCPNKDTCPFRHVHGDPGGRRPDNVTIRDPKPKFVAPRFQRISKRPVLPVKAKPGGNNGNPKDPNTKA